MRKVIGHFFGIPVTVWVDDEAPKDQIVFFNDAGQIVGSIVNLAGPEPPEGETAS